MKLTLTSITERFLYLILQLFMEKELNFLKKELLSANNYVNGGGLMIKEMEEAVG